MFARALLPVALLFVAALAAPLGSQSTVFGELEVQTVEVSEGGFNPAVCRMNRDYVQFKNVGSTPRRVIRRGVIAGDPPLFDTGVLAPGQTSNKIRIPYGGSTPFEDAEDSSHTMTVVTPVFVEYWQPDCTPDPEFRPPEPPCRGNPYCLRIAAIAMD